MVELLLLAAALSADNFAVSIGYGSSNTRISPGMTALLNLFCSAALVASAQFGKRFLQSAGPEWGTRVGAGCFFLMGTLKIFEELRKRRRKKQGKPETRLEHLEKQLHPLEFGLLAVSMSVDGIVSGVFAADPSRSEWRRCMPELPSEKRRGRKTAETEHCSEEFCSIYWRF